MGSSDRAAPGVPENVLAVAGSDLYAGTYGAGVWRRPLSEMITSVDPMADALPDGFVLQQNYPDPFNPSTTIPYALPHRSHVTLTIFNTLGQRVATLVNREVEAGEHAAGFDATGMAGGVYFYHMQAGAYTQTKKLCLIH